MKFLLLILTVAGILHSNLNGGEEVISASTVSRLKSIYSEIGPLFINDSSEHIKKQGQGQNEVEIELIPESFEPSKYFMYGDISLQVWAKDFSFQSAHNSKLDAKLGGIDRKFQSSLSNKGAVAKAKGFLRKFQIQIPENTRLTVSEFNSRYASCWEIRWTRQIGDYPWDDFNPAELESIHVVFHESFGLVAIGNNISSPAPKDLEVKLSKEQAELKASEYVTLVQRTPYYQQARMEGFIVSGVKSCELKVATPNWLLNPDRAIWMRNKPPEETRLCWVVRFTTANSKAEERNLKSGDGKRIELISPEILIYLDAATGECVGANFT